MGTKSVVPAGPLERDVRPQAFRTFEDMCWAVPGERLNELEYRMRYAPKDFVFDMGDRLTVAALLACYRELVSLPERERNNRIREIRKGPNARNEPPAVAGRLD